VVIARREALLYDKPIRRTVHDDIATADLQEAKMWLALLDAEQGDSVAELALLLRLRLYRR
jgi:hypothetical protein